MADLERYSASFDGFRDEPGSPFYAAEGQSPEETNHEIVSCMDGVLREVVAYHQAGELIPLTTDALCEWHRGIFATTFPQEAGRLRSRSPSGRWELVSFGIDIGTQMTRRILGRRGTHPRRIRRRLDRIFERHAIEYERASAGVLLREATLSATHVYAKTVSVHGFVDGNLRASFVALQAVLLNYDLPPVIFKDLAAHDDHLSTALRPGGRRQSYEPFADHLAELIQARRDR